MWNDIWYKHFMHKKYTNKMNLWMQPNGILHFMEFLLSLAFENAYPKLMTFIALFISITMRCGLIGFYEKYSQHSTITWEIFCKILLVPQDIVMDMNNVMLYKRSDITYTFFDFVPTIPTHECLIKQACNIHFVVGFENIQNLGDHKG